MYSCDFLYNLKRCNNRLYVATDAQSVMSSEWKAQGLYVRRRASHDKLETGLLAKADDQTRKMIEDQESGQKDEYVMAVPRNWVPEFPVFDQKTGKLLARGWRGILLDLSKRGLLTIDKARRVFGCRSLGETDYDLMTFDEKRFQLKKEQKRKG